MCIARYVAPCLLVGSINVEQYYCRGSYVGFVRQVSTNNQPDLVVAGSGNDCCDSKPRTGSESQAHLDEFEKADRAVPVRTHRDPTGRHPPTLLPGPAATRQNRQGRPGCGHAQTTPAPECGGPPRETFVATRRSGHLNLQCLDSHGHAVGLVPEHLRMRNCMKWPCHRPLVRGRRRLDAGAHPRGLGRVPGTGPGPLRGDARSHRRSYNLARALWTLWDA